MNPSKSAHARLFTRQGHGEGSGPVYFYLRAAVNIPLPVIKKKSNIFNQQLRERLSHSAGN